VKNLIDQIIILSNNISTFYKTNQDILTEDSKDYANECKTIEKEYQEIKGKKDRTTAEKEKVIFIEFLKYIF
jgi:uncharacterized membrane protein YfhO